MKTICLGLLACLLIIGGDCLGQKYKSDSGKIRFYSEAPLEDIDAITHQARAALDLEKREVAVLVDIKSFTFDKALMQEHFNENYMESDKYPSATFSGTFVMPQSSHTNIASTLKIKGEMKIHGVSKEYQIDANLSRDLNGRLKISGKFMVALNDHGIRIPKLLFQNIADVVEVTVDFELIPE